jgi:hypothetical protein
MKHATTPNPISHPRVRPMICLLFGFFIRRRFFIFIRQLLTGIEYRGAVFACQGILCNSHDLPYGKKGRDDIEAANFRVLDLRQGIGNQDFADGQV